MIEFNNNGYLPPGLHNYTHEEFYSQFVDQFAFSQKRPIVYLKSFEWLSMLSQIAVPVELWLDGSFTTNKINPNDVDVAIFYNRNLQLTPEQKNNFYQLISCCKGYYCDVLCSTMIDKQSSNDEINHRNYLRGQFGYDRKDVPKGIIVMGQDEVIKGLGGLNNG
jgi:hypothetical protein